jgi:glutamyl-tRNA(Gln) amidotransferase subunit E
MSIKNGQRIEIKGVQEPKLIAKTIKTEIKRQKELIKDNKSKAEVRKANPDGSTNFLRPLPGASRMYPETDLPLLIISKKMIDKAKKTLPKLKTEIKQELKISGLGDEMIKILLTKNKLEDFKNLIKIYNKPNFIVKTLVLWPNEIASHNNIQNIEKKIPIDVIEYIIEAVAKNKVKEENVKNILKDIAQGKDIEKAIQIEKADTSSIEEDILKLLKEKPNLSIGAYMGILIQKYKGKISGKELSELLKKHLKK